MVLMGFTGFVTTIALAATLAAGSAPHAKWVDPFIGTGGHGHTFPGATLPFGMVQLSPDTRLRGWDGCSGYHDSDRVIFGFSHTHLSGTGASDYGDILLMPMAGEPRLDNGDRGEGQEPHGGYASRFSKDTERAGAGWYSVVLADSGIGVDLTVTPRTGWHRYRFPRGAPAHVVIDLTHRDKLVESSLRAAGGREVEGFRRSTGWADDQVVYFVARFSRPFVSSSFAGPKGVLSFGEAGGDLIVKVGISAVDLDGARRNLDAESQGWNFDAARAAAVRRWDDALSRVEVAGGTTAQRIILYTGLYHSLIVPNLFSDVDGRYRGMDRQIHRVEGRQQYTVFSLWDTFRATHPLFTLLEPRRDAEFIRTFLAMYREGGRLPVWELAGNETDTMIGYHAVSVIADAWVKGIRDFDAGEALEAMRHSASLDRDGLESYRRQGFIGAGDAAESVSRTLEYGYDDYCIATMAAGLGSDGTAREFFRRSQAWRHLLDPDTGFMRPRADQRWLDPFDPKRVDNNYTEANAWQYSFFVPHDLESLIASLGGDAPFIDRLDRLFAADSATTGRRQVDITGLIGQYAQGNEPSHHMAWLYHYAGRPDRSAERVRAILDTLYRAAPDGLAGNEDCGQMSSWYVLAAMGLYPVCPCTDQYALTPPLFDRITLRPDGGRAFTIRAEGAGPAPRYITAARLNGAPLARSWLRHEEIARGGELVLTLGPKPDPTWGRAPADRPPSRVEGERVVAAPFVKSGAATFAGSEAVELGCAEPDAIIRWTLDASQPVDGWAVYRGPVEVTGTATMRMRAEAGGRISPIVQASFHQRPNDWTVTVAAPPSAQYTAGGPEALIDGLRGGLEWRTGGWQGYQSADFEAVVDLRAPRALRHAGAGFLQDVRSWIWMPREVVVSVSADGVDWKEAGRLPGGLPEDDETVARKDLLIDLGGVEARYVKVRAVSLGAIPAWHPGRGDRAFLFVDEILID